MDDRLETRRAPKKTDHTMVEGMSASSSTFKLNGYPPSILCRLTGARQEREIEKNDGVCVGGAWMRRVNVHAYPVRCLIPEQMG
jgi:hypothetical protein